jgi:hypothetical protein
MPATLRGIYNYNIYPQPDFNAEQDQNGAWTARQSFIVSKTTWASSEWRNKFDIGTQITVINPTLAEFYSFLRVASSSFTEDGGDIVTIQVDFAGSQTAQYGFAEGEEPQDPTYRLEGRLSEQPLSEHPKWTALPATERNPLQLLLNDELVWIYDDVFTNSWLLCRRSGDDLVASDYTLTSANAIAFADMIAKGIKTYIAPTVTWTETTSGNSPMISAQINSLGKISTPRGNPPDAAGTRNWMLTSASQEQRGTLYQTQLEWTMSEKDGWSEFLYD